MIFEIPYDFIESVFGTWFADNFNTLMLLIFLAVAGYIVLIKE